MSQKANTLASDGQMNQIASIVGAATKKALKELGIDSDGAQRILTSGGDLQERLREPLMAALRDLGTTNQYASEEVTSTFTYPAEYTGAKPLIVQASILGQDFPGLGLMNEKLAAMPLITGAEGKFVVPLWQKLAPTYGEAVELVLAKLAAKRKVYNHREGRFGSQYLRQHVRSIERWDRLAKQQEGCDLLVVDAQFGMRHRGRSVRRARELFAPNEFGFGAFAGLIMHLTHPEREVRWEQLHSDFAGDEYAPGAGGGFCHAPVCNFYGDGLGFRTGGLGRPYEDYGSVSGFLPE